MGRQRFEKQSDIEKEESCREWLVQKYGKQIHGRLNANLWVVDWVRIEQNKTPVFMEYKWRDYNYGTYDNYNVCAHKLNVLRQLARDFDSFSVFVLQLNDRLMSYRINADEDFSNMTIWWGRNDSRDEQDSSICYEVPFSRFKTIVHEYVSIRPIESNVVPF
jgi:hypothetical protein